jgi:molybdopterin-binding protein
VVRQAAEDLRVQAGGEVYAAIKASAFRRLY